MPERNPFGGRYVYAIRYSNGIVKVGQTLNPRSRIGGHRQIGFVFGAELEHCWLSPAHTEYRESEANLIRLASVHGGSIISREYFAGADFEALVLAADRRRYRTICNDGDRKSAKVLLDVATSDLVDLDVVANQLGVDVRALAEDCRNRVLDHVRTRDRFAMIPDQIWRVPFVRSRLNEAKWRAA